MHQQPASPRFLKSGCCLLAGKPSTLSRSIHVPHPALPRLTQHGGAQAAVEGGAAALPQQYRHRAAHAAQVGVNRQPQAQRVQRVSQLWEGGMWWEWRVVGHGWVGRRAKRGWLVQSMPHLAATCKHGLSRG